MSSCRFCIHQEDCERLRHAIENWTDYAEEAIHKDITSTGDIVEYIEEELYQECDNYKGCDDA